MVPTDFPNPDPSSTPVVGELVLRCHICRGQLDADDLFCPNCGTETAKQESDPAKSTVSVDWITHHFSCQGCGASMSYDARAQNLRCPFCGSEKIQEQEPSKTLRAKYVIPFQQDREAVMQTLTKWMGRSFWRPRDLASGSVITQMAPVFVPYWVFQAEAETNWTADSSNVPWSARGDWMPVTGDHSANYAGILIGASSVLSPVETASICPFNLNGGQSMENAQLENYIIEQFRVQRKYARPLARASIESLEREACRKFVLGRARNVKVNVKLSGIYSEPVLLPVWILAYRYKGDLYRFLANGQTGRHTGTAPVSWARMVALGAALFAAAFVLLLLISLLFAVA